MAESQNLISKSRVARATKWSFAGEIAAKLISPITNMILARLLAPEIFGIVATINMVIGFADIFAGAGFQLYLIQHDFTDEEELHSYASSAFWISALIGILMVLGIALFRHPLAALVGSPGHGNALLIAALSIPLVAIISNLQSIYRRNLNYKPLFLRRMLALAVPLAVTIPLALLGMGIWSLVIGSLSGKVIELLALLAGKCYNPRLSCRLSHVVKMAPFCLTTLADQALSWATTWIDIFIIGSILGSYYTGLYKNSQSTVIGILAIVTTSLTPVLFSVLCRHAQDDRQFVQTMREFTENLSFFLLPIGFGILVCRRLITYVILGSAWMEAADFIGIWGLATTFSAVYATYNREACCAKGKPYLNIVAHMISLAAIIPASYFGARAGFHTMIYWRSAAVLALILGYCVVIAIGLRLNPLRWFAATLPSLLCAALMCLVITALQARNPALWLEIVLVAVGIVVYFALLALFPRQRLMMREWLEKGKRLFEKLCRRSKKAP